MNQQLNLVRQFHQAFEYAQARHNTEGFLTQKQALLRYSCITEEIGELGMAVCAGSRKEILDALIDLDYFILGTLAILGSDIATEDKYSLVLYPGKIEDVLVKVHYQWTHFSGCFLIKGQETNPVARDDIINGLSDMHYLIVCLVVHRVKGNYPKSFMEVHRSNMSKLENGKPVYNEAGKIMKGSSFSLPDLTPFLVAA